MRILLKLSGEALAGEKKTGFDEETVRKVALQVKKLVDDGTEVGIVIGGGNFKFDLASQKKSQIDVTTATGEQISVIDNIRVKKMDIAAEVGAGFDFYNSYFKFGIEVKMSFGLLNVMDKQDLIYDSSIKSMKNRTFQVSLTFE